MNLAGSLAVFFLKKPLAGLGRLFLITQKSKFVRTYVHLSQPVPLHRIPPSAYTVRIRFLAHDKREEINIYSIYTANLAALLPPLTSHRSPFLLPQLLKYLLVHFRGKDINFRGLPCTRDIVHDWLGFRCPEV